MIREGRELLLELARLNGGMARLGVGITNGSASVAEQAYYAQRLIPTGERLNRRVEAMVKSTIEGEVLAEGAIDLPANTVEPG